MFKEVDVTEQYRFRSEADAFSRPLIEDIDYKLEILRGFGVNTKGIDFSKIKTKIELDKFSKKLIYKALEEYKDEE
jgi:hypothetical protein